MFILLTTLWFIWELKYILFWLYLWQLKDYHVPRFVDHFRTQKGKELIFNFFQILKLIILVLFLAGSQLFSQLSFILVLVYLAQDILVVRAVLNNSIKRPVKTAKIIFLVCVSVVVAVSFSFGKFSFLIFDILTPIIISAIVLLFQPFFVLLRNRILAQASEKMNGLRQVSGIKVVAITGSFGKTSTKEFLTTILSKKFKVLSTKNHQNSEIGVANSILQDLKPSHQIFIAEVGAYDKGKVKEVCLMIKPKIGIVTGVNEQHLALFGSMDNLLSAEGGRELESALSKDGVLIVNGDNKYCLDLYKDSNLNKKLYSFSNKVVDADIWSDSITVEKDKVSFVVINKNREMAPFEVNVLGRQSVQNLLGAILVARELGMTFGEISEACKDIVQSQSGMALRVGDYGIDVVDSSYSSNPDGVLADLDYFSIFTGKKVVVMPCLIELGVKSAEIHEKIGRKIGEICDLAIITSKDYFNEIEKGFSETKKTGARILLCDNPQDIRSLVMLLCKAGDAVLLEGRVPNGLVDLLAGNK